MVLGQAWGASAARQATGGAPGVRVQGPTFLDRSSAAAASLPCVSLRQLRPEREQANGRAMVWGEAAQVWFALSRVR